MSKESGEERGSLELPDLTRLPLPGEALVRRTWSLFFGGLGLLIAGTLITLSLVRVEVAIEGSGALLGQDESPRRAELFVPAAQAGDVSVGQPVRLTVAGQGAVLNGQVEALDPDQQGAHLRIWVTLNGSTTTDVPSGVGVEARVQAGWERAWHRLLRAAGRRFQDE